MAYEYSDKNSKVTLPNPYRIENYFLFSVGIVFLALGLAMLWIVRDHIQTTGLSLSLLLSFFIALFLMSSGGAWLWRGASQMNYFTGRGLPRSLAPDIPDGKNGTSKNATYIKETIRNGAISFRDPGSNPLYRILPNLVFAPVVVRSAAETLAQNGVVLSFYILSMILAFFLTTPDGNTSSWIGIFYLLVGYKALLLPMIQGNLTATNNTNGKAQLSIGFLIFLATVAIIGPVLLNLVGAQLPNLPALHLRLALFISAVSMLVSTALGLVVIHAQLGPAPTSVGSARETEILTMNSHPAKLVEQINRMLMDRWFDGIPNRRYIHSTPEIAGETGSFRFEILQETQPLPSPGVTPKDIYQSLASHRFLWLFVLSAYFLLLSIVAGISVFSLGLRFLSPENPTFLLILSGGMLIASVYTFRCGHSFWGRYDYLSKIFWIEAEGSFEKAHIEMGKTFSDTIKSGKDIINIEAMTLRVWASEFDSVLFHRNGERQILSMRGLPDDCRSILQELALFGKERSTIVAPAASLDVERMSGIKNINRSLNKSDGNLLSQESQNILERTTKSEEQPESRNFCGDCGQRVDPTDRFCGSCGAALTA